MKVINEIAVLMAVLFTFIFGIGIYALSVSPHSYGEPEMGRVLWWTQIILVGITLFFVFKYFTWKTVGFGKMKALPLLWLLPSVVGLALVFPLAFQYSQANVETALLVLAITALVSFGEEVAYRGVVLRTFINNTSPRKAIMYSSLLFSLLHIVNYMAYDAEVWYQNPVWAQLGYTFVFGVFASGFVLLTRNLWPIILLHWLNNFINIAAGAVTDGNMSSIVMSIIAVLTPAAFIFSIIAGIIFLAKANDWFGQSELQNES